MVFRPNSEATIDKLFAHRIDQSAHVLIARASGRFEVTDTIGAPTVPDPDDFWTERSCVRILSLGHAQGQLFTNLIREIRF